MANDPFESSGRLEEDLGMFEAAAHSRPLELKKPTVNTIVTALDGSNQDQTATLIAETLAVSTSARVVSLSGVNRAADILKSCRQEKADLLIIPVPFGHDISELKDESLGSVVDMLMLEAPCPVLCVRQLMDRDGVNEMLEEVLLPVTGTCPHDALRAAGWAFRVVANDGQIELLAVADQDAIAELRELLSPAAQAECNAETMNRSVTDEISSLVSAVQKHAAEMDVEAIVNVRTGRFVPTVLETANNRPRLIVVGTPREHTAGAFHRAVDLILGADGPVLIV